jgi:hypothetical protein
MITETILNKNPPNIKQITPHPPLKGGRMRNAFVLNAVF